MDYKKLSRITDSVNPTTLVEEVLDADYVVIKREIDEKGSCFKTAEKIASLIGETMGGVENFKKELKASDIRGVSYKKGDEEDYKGIHGTVVYGAEDSVEGYTLPSKPADEFKEAIRQAAFEFLRNNKELLLFYKPDLSVVEIHYDNGFEEEAPEGYEVVEIGGLDDAFNFVDRLYSEKMNDSSEDSVAVSEFKEKFTEMYREAGSVFESLELSEELTEEEKTEVWKWANSMVEGDGYRVNLIDEDFDEGENPSYFVELVDLEES